MKKKTDFLISYIFTPFQDIMDVPSQNVLTAQQEGCRCTKYTGYYCGQPVIDVPNATMCVGCFQIHYQDLLYSLERPWCKNHNNGCLSELPDYKPLPGIQSYTPPGCPGGSFQHSGFFLLGWYCAACSLWNVAHSEEKAEDVNAVPVYTEKKKRARSLSTSEILIDQLQHLPGKTEAQIDALSLAREAHVRLKLREKKLKKDQDELQKTLEILTTFITPTDN